jgi:ParB/RepB/Spo0J family partition protein
MPTAVAKRPQLVTKATEDFAMIPIERLRESPLNPRKHYDPHKLEELAESIDDRGVITPLIVRECSTPESVVKGKFVLNYEIAAGHRRYRAAKSLERPIELPCRIMILDDDEFLEVLTIENLQREDIHPLEEADGYKALLATGRYQEPDFAGEEVRNLADKIGKPEAYVLRRLELCDLVPVARESFLQNNITIGHARLISRLPADRQEWALRECFHEDWQTKVPELVTVAELKRELKREQGEDLSKAPFDLEDETLKRDAGPCTTCPRCTGTQRSLLADDTAEQLCLDRSCYSQKLNAHIMRQTAAGLVAISTRHSGEIPAGVVSAREYVEAEKDSDQIEELRGELEFLKQTPDEDEGEIAKLENELAEAEAESGKCAFMQRAIIVDSHGGGKIGHTIDICSNPECPVHGEAVADNNSIYGGSSRKDPSHAKAEEKRKLDRKVDQLARRRAWNAILSGLGPKPKVDSQVLYLAATGFFHTANADFCKAFGIEVEKGQYDHAKKWCADASDAELVRFIVGAALGHAGTSEYFDRQYQGKEEWSSFKDLMTKYKVDFPAIEKEARAELKAKSAKKTKAARS